VLVLGPGKKRLLVGGEFSWGGKKMGVKREKEKKEQHLL
jgi:hypothetical protein